ncbi:unnamed protein product, partial [Brachionus calyciflorus]
MNKELKFYKNLIFGYYEKLKSEIDSKASNNNNNDEKIKTLKKSYFELIGKTKNFNYKNFETKHFNNLAISDSNKLNSILFENKFLFFIKSNLNGFGQLIQTDKFINQRSRQIIEGYVIEWTKTNTVKMKLNILDSDQLDSYLLVKYSIDLWNQLSVLELNSELFKNLVQLHLMCHNLTQIDNCFRNVINCLTLEELHLQSNQIKFLSPNCFEDLKNLKKLNLSKNEIKRISQCFNGLENLEVLDISMNLIEKLEVNSFKEMKNLKMLNLSFNKLESLDFVFIKSLTKLNDLIVCNNCLKEIFIDVVLNELETIDLEWNFLISIQEEFDKFLPNLKLLNLSNNKLKSM